VGVAGVSWWAITRDLVIACALLGGYAWLGVLSVRVRGLHRRLAVHVCREPDTGRAGDHSEGRGRVDAAEILRREQDTPRPMLPRVPTAEVTHPIPVVRTTNHGRKYRR